MAEMKAKEIVVDLNELNEFKKKNFEDRLNFINFWTDYIKKHSDEEWSKQQATIIDSQIRPQII
jgi:hypothetical protein